MISSKLQYELDKAVKTGKTVEMRGKTYELDRPVIVPSNVLLRCTTRTVFESENDIDMFTLMPNGRMVGNGATIINTNPECDKAKIKLDASIETFENKGNRTHVSGFLLQGSANEPEKGKGLHLYASGSRNAIQACIFRDMTYLGLNVAIHEEVIGTGGVTYVNGNRHSGIKVDDCRHGLVQNASGAGAIGTHRNQYLGLMVQAGRNMQSVIDILGGFNEVQGQIHDWSVSDGEFAVKAAERGCVFTLPGILREYMDVNAGSIILAPEVA